MRTMEIKYNFKFLLLISNSDSQRILFYALFHVCRECSILEFDGRAERSASCRDLKSAQILSKNAISGECFQIAPMFCLF